MFATYLTATVLLSVAELHIQIYIFVIAAERASILIKQVKTESQIQNIK